MELILGGGLALALVIVYFTAKRSGKLEERDRTKSKIVEGLLRDFDTLQTQMHRWEERQEKIDSRLKGIDVAILSDDQLSELYKDPVSYAENTHTAEMDQSLRSIGEKKPKE